MIIVAGWLRVRPERAAAYVAGCRDDVELARRAPGCLDFAVAEDPYDPGRINVYERWRDRASLHTFRGTGPGADQLEAIVAADVGEYVVDDVAPG